ADRAEPVRRRHALAFDPNVFAERAPEADVVGEEPEHAFRRSVEALLHEDLRHARRYPTGDSRSTARTGARSRGSTAARNARSTPVGATTARAARSIASARSTSGASPRTTSSAAANVGARPRPESQCTS